MDCTLLALIVLSDPIRPEAPEILDYFYDQGVDVKIISGDDARTVQQIAAAAGVRDADLCVDASALKEEEIEAAVERYTVFGRVSPVQKKQMIEALKRKGHITAMTGDGVNDVMALKEADCSIAMAQGSEAAKNIANLVLLDSNFSHLPDIVNEGRRVINNIQRTASLFLVKTSFSVILGFLTLFFIPIYPFEPIQLTLISTVSIGIPSFFLALEPNHERVRGNFLRNVFSKALPGALCVVLSVFYVYALTAIEPLSPGGHLHAVRDPGRLQLAGGALPHQPPLQHEPPHHLRRDVPDVRALHHRAAAGFLVHARAAQPAAAVMRRCRHRADPPSAERAVLHLRAADLHPPGSAIDHAKDRRAVCLFCGQRQ